MSSLVLSITAVSNTFALTVRGKISCLPTCWIALWLLERLVLAAIAASDTLIEWRTDKLQVLGVTDYETFVEELECSVTDGFLFHPFSSPPLPSFLLSLHFPPSTLSSLPSLPHFTLTLPLTAICSRLTARPCWPCDGRSPRLRTRSVWWTSRPHGERAAWKSPGESSCAALSAAS